MAKLIFFLGFMGTLLGMAALVFTNDGSGMEESQANLGNTSSPAVTIQAGSGETIQYQTQNGRNRGGFEPEVYDIPRLILFHNQNLTESAQRTLQIDVSGLQIPSPGATVTLLVETQDGDPDPGGDQGNHIPVWEAATWIDSDGTSDGALTLSQTFEETLVSGDGRINTPTGYFRYEITIADAEDQTALYTFQQDYAFLMENIWTASLPDVPEESPGAAPDELVIYYCDMIPFQKNIHDISTWIPRQAVHDYVGAELLPRMVGAFRLQSQDWGFPWYQAWTAGRGDQDAERLSVTLTDGWTWYHGEAFSRGSSKISINVAGSENYRYESLTDGVMSTFHHELFHNHQKNIDQHLGGSGWIGGKNEQWQFFAEGMAVLASSVAQPDIQFAADGAERAYFSNANRFLGSASIRGDIGRDFSQISPYHAVLYWRLLFEQCGGMGEGLENPAAGMTIIRRTLTSLYQIAEGQAGPNGQLSDWMPTIMDLALTGSTCPFQTYQDSLAAFSQAVDALRHENGRCQSPGLPEGCSFYDPHALYNDLPDNTIALMAVSP